VKCRQIAWVVPFLLLRLNADGAAIGPNLDQQQRFQQQSTSEFDGVPAAVAVGDALKSAVARTMMEEYEGPNFSDEIVSDIANSLPEPLNKRRLELLPKILCEWGLTDLREHLSMESRLVIQARIRKLESVGKRAQRLLEALNAVDALGRLVIKRQMIHADGRTLETASRSELSTLDARLDEGAGAKSSPLSSNVLGKLASRISTRRRIGWPQPKNQRQPAGPMRPISLYFRAGAAREV
jgi:hypothetical protein